MPNIGEGIAELFRDVWIVRVFGAITTLLVVLAFLFCIANGQRNGYNYLLALNVLITGLIGALVTKWYSVGELAASKLWYMIALGLFLSIQSIVYDVFSFHDPHSAEQNITNSA